jgi:hypothetical protein
MMKSGRCHPELSGLSVHTLPLCVLNFLVANLNLLDGRKNAQKAQG